MSGDDFEERTNVNEGTGPDPGEYMGKNQISAKGREGDDKQGKKSQVKDWMLVDRPVPTVPLGPRWCRFCEIYKPDRTHQWVFLSLFPFCRVSCQFKCDSAPKF